MTMARWRFLMQRHAIPRPHSQKFPLQCCLRRLQQRVHQLFVADALEERRLSRLQSNLPCQPGLDPQIGVAFPLELLHRQYRDEKIPRRVSLQLPPPGDKPSEVQISDNASRLKQAPTLTQHGHPENCGPRRQSVSALRRPTSKHPPPPPPQQPPQQTRQRPARSQ